jgi:hypothetical protein
MHQVFKLKVLVFLMCLYSANVISSELQKSGDVELAHILTTSEMLYKSDKNFPMFVEVIQTWEEISECGGTYESCPNARLYITSASGDLYEAPHLYQLPKAKGWAVVKSKATEHYLFITVKTTLEHANVSLESRNKWNSKSYTVKVSKYDGLVSLVN